MCNVQVVLIISTVYVETTVELIVCTGHSKLSIQSLEKPCSLIKNVLCSMLLTYLDVNAREFKQKLLSPNSHPLISQINVLSA